MATHSVTVDAPTLADLSECLDLHGFLKDFSLWNWDVARFIASGERIQWLTSGHWQVLEYARKYFKCYSSWPLPARMERDIGIDPRHLFRTCPEIVFKIAGLPDPCGNISWDTKSLRDCNCLYF